MHLNEMWRREWNVENRTKNKINKNKYKDLCTTKILLFKTLPMKTKLEAKNIMKKLEKILAKLVDKLMLAR